MLLYIKSELKSNQVLQQELQGTYESVWCEVKLKDRDKLLVGSLYRSPNNTDKENEDFTEMMRRVSTYPSSHKLVLGDFNCPRIDWTSETSKSGEDNINSKMLECFRDTFWHQHVREATHHRPGCQSTLIDLIMTNEEGMIKNLNHLAPLGASHHQVLKFNFSCYYIQSANQAHRLLHHKADFEGMRAELQEINWDNLLEGKQALETHKTIEETITKMTEKHTPKSKPSGRRSTKKPLWMNSKSLAKVKKKYHTFKRYMDSREGEDYLKYSQARNQSRWECRKAIRDFEKKIAAEAKKNPKSFYRYARSKLKTKTTIADLVREDGSLASSDKEKAEALNEFFGSVFTREDLDNMPTFEDRLFNSLLEDMEFTVEDVKKKLDKLKPDKSPGPDSIHPKILHELSDVLAKPLTILFQKSLQESMVPEEWKKSNVTPIFKKGTKSSTSNYRPVSLTSVICKVMESLIRDKLMSHMCNNNLLNNCQHGFRTGRSCVTQLLDMMETWTNILDSYGSIDAIYLDFRKAFDTVPHERLLLKLHGYGIRGNMLSWIRQFLVGRTQRVVVNSEKSKWSPVLSGIPQGSVLGPTLFILYVNDMPDAIHSTLLMFADDTKIFRRINSLADCEELQKDLEQLKDWSVKWLLDFNSSKCKRLHMGPNNPEFEYSLPEGENSTKLEQTTAEKDLGVWVDKQLDFSRHVEEQAGKANRILGMIRSSFTYLDTPTLRKLYTSLVRPHLEYANSVWNPLYLKDAHAIENVQRRATRLVPELQKERIYGRDKRKPDYVERLRILKLPSLFYRRARGDMIEVWKYLNDVYQVDQTMLKRDECSSTRGHCHKLKKQHNRLKLRSHFFSQRVVTAWNNLPKEVAEASTLLTFKCKLDKAWEEFMYIQHPMF